MFMILIAAAMEEELRIAMSLFRNPEKVRARDADFWQATLDNQIFGFLKTGIGPRRSAASLHRMLQMTKPSSILVIGYAGALDPALKLGTLIAVDKALACSVDKARPSLAHMQLDGAYELARSHTLVQEAKSIGIIAERGTALTSGHVLADPGHKTALFEKYHASIVDMETAALARAARDSDVPLSCVRAISDEAGDSFLARFSYDPSVGIPTRAARLLRKGNPVRAYSEWRDHAAVARETLGRFLAHCLLRQDILFVRAEA
jgi:nucleoside phosphorylase